MRRFPSRSRSTSTPRRATALRIEYNATPDIHSLIPNCSFIGCRNGEVAPVPPTVAVDDSATPKAHYF